MSLPEINEARLLEIVQRAGIDARLGRSARDEISEAVKDVELIAFGSFERCLPNGTCARCPVKLAGWIDATESNYTEFGRSAGPPARLDNFWAAFDRMMTRELGGKHAGVAVVTRD